MNALPLILGVLCCLAIAYRYYSAFLATKVMCLDDTRVTPAHALSDGQNYHPTPKWVLFGHHFAAITGAGPLIGPVLAAQFGFLPGLLWIVIGVCLAGAVQDFVILSASVRRGGRSLAEIARAEIGPVAGLTTACAILFIVVIALAGLGLAVVNALKDSSWGVFTIGVTIPVALIMGAWMKRGRGQATVPATVFGVTCLLGAVVAGAFIPGSAIAPWFTFGKDGITYLIAAYGFLASVLPVWLLLAPRDYLSTFMKIGTIAVLIGGVLVVHPDLKMPAISQFAAGGGPIIPGKLFPFVFITIACGAISGFHALVGSGTTPKMVMKESHCRTIGYGAMLMEGVVGVVSLIAASSLYPGDYFAVNVSPDKFATLGMSTVNLPHLAQAV
ncbi:MAG TPA: carbon starvation CstA family protein, partial [Verrucomicrobiae bacterium]|nr:carbon starvation CstA family protein [Verrucomicrobiae bacterium]